MNKQETAALERAAAQLTQSLYQGKRLPVPGEYIRGTGTLVEVQESEPPPPPPPPVEDYIFEEITAEVEIRKDGKPLREVESLWDFYGYETSVEAAIKTAKHTVTGYNITPASELEVVVIRVATRVRNRLTNRNNPYAKEYADFEPKGTGSRADLPDPVRTVVWSSRNAMETKPAPQDSSSK